MRERDGLTFLVQTSLGNSLLPGQSKAYVNIHGDVYLPVDVSDLKEGQMVLYKKEFIDKTLEEIIPRLEKSERYVAARDAIHVSNPNGERVTKLKFDLVSSIGASLPISNLESKLYGDSNDFTEEEYSQMVDRVEQDLAEGGLEHTYHRSTIKSWLDGTTLAPKDWAVFDALAKKDARFKEYTDPESLVRDHYELYVTVHQGVMRYLASKGKESPKTKSVKSSGKGRSLKTEIDLVVEALMEDKDTQYATAEVTSVSKVTARDIETKIRPKFRLADGVEAGALEGANKRAISYADLLTHRNALEGVFHFVLERYLLAQPSITYRRADGFIGTLDKYAQSALTDLLLMKEMKKISPSQQRILTLSHGTGGIEQMMQGIKQVVTDLSDGTFDSQIGLQPGASMRMYRALVHLRDLTPPAVDQMEAQRALNVLREGGLQGKIREQLFRNTLTNKYGINLQEVATPLSMSFSVGPESKDTKGVVLRDAEFMDKLARGMAEKELLHRILSKDQARTILDGYGLGEMISFVPEPVWSADAWRPKAK